LIAFAVILASVFLLGRISAEKFGSEPATAQVQQLSGQTKQVVKDTPSVEASPEKTDSVEDGSADTVSVKDTGDSEEDSETSGSTGKEQSGRYIPSQDKIVVGGSEDVNESSSSSGGEDYDADSSSCTPKPAGFNYNYTNVAIDVSNFQREIKDSNWATLTAVKLTVTNIEKCLIINPTKIKLKMNPKGKGSVWWDDDVWLPDSFRNMYPGDTVTEIVSIHVSYSDIYSEKDFRLSVFDDYDIPIGTFKKNIFLP
jgi:hypothetical protein